MDRPDRAMVVTPHPDDAEIGCGGTIAGWIAEGTEVVYVVCTNGDKGTGDPDMTSPRLAEIREVEQAEAATDMGVKEVIYLRHGDGDLEDNKEFREQVVRAIRQHQPQVVFTTDPFRRGFYLHRDHRICGQVTIDATYPYARDHLHFPEHKAEGLETHKVADIMLWGTEEPDTFIDITDTIERKISSLKKHASQVSSDDGDVGDFIKSNGQRVGQRANFPYGEAFRRIQIRN